MRTLNKNKTKLYYSLYLGQTPITDENGNFTGEYEPTYSAPTELWANISPSRGMADMDVFGVNADFTKSVIVDDVTLAIDETSRLWIDADPATEPYNYIVRQIAKSFWSITYAVKKVNTNNG